MTLREILDNRIRHLSIFTRSALAAEIEALYERRITELLEKNNELLERARVAERNLEERVADYAGLSKITIRLVTEIDTLKEKLAA